MQPAQPDRALRIATYNVEWFNALFDDEGRPLPDAEPSARYKTTRGQQLGALAQVFRAVNADAIMVIEAPDSNGRRSSVRALQNFANLYGLRTNEAISGFTSETEQEIILLYDGSLLTARHDPQSSAEVPRFDRVFHYDLDTDARPETIRFSKPPLEVALEGAGYKLRLIGVHAKSKAPHGARNAAQVVRLGIENRRKQLAQCLWIRARVKAHLAAGDNLIVLGDFNDGPGLDEYEQLFGESGIEIVLGTLDGPEMALNDPHAAMALGQRIGIAPTSARFYDRDKRRYFGALLDFIMASPRLSEKEPVWRIWHPLDDPECWTNEQLRMALLTASDHFPVTIDLQRGGKIPLESPS
jgi:endonuclease/exonuclease/phosphatase family metal-dependent hydrolase